MRTRIITSIVGALSILVLLLGGDAEARMNGKPGTAAHYKRGAVAEMVDQSICPLAVAGIKGVIHKPGTLAHRQRFQDQSVGTEPPVCEEFVMVTGNAKIHKPGTQGIKKTVSTHALPACEAAQIGRSHAGHKPGTQMYLRHLRDRGESSGDAVCDRALSMEGKASQVCCLKS